MIDVIKEPLRRLVWRRVKALYGESNKSEKLSGEMWNKGLRKQITALRGTHNLAVTAILSRFLCYVALHFALLADPELLVRYKRRVLVRLA